MAQTDLERLILIQMIYEKGEDSFGEIARKMQNHPLLPGCKLNARDCENLYQEMLREANLRVDADNNGASPKDAKGKKTRKAYSPPSWVRQLAQIHYMSYTEKLLQEMKQDEEEFKREFQRLQELQGLI